MHLRSYRILQTSLHGGPQIFLKFCTHSYISERNLSWKFQLSDAYGCRDMNTLRFETKPRFAKSWKRKIAIFSEIFIENLQFFFFKAANFILFPMKSIILSFIKILDWKFEKFEKNFTPLCGEIAKMRIFKNFWNYIFLIAQNMFFEIVTILSWQIWDFL